MPCDKTAALDIAVGSVRVATAIIIISLDTLCTLQSCNYHGIGRYTVYVALVLLNIVSCRQ